MAKYPSIRLSIAHWNTPTVLQEKLLDLIGDDNVKRGVNQIIADRAEKFVPSESGALRQSVKVGPNTISWGSGLNYGHYQYEGEVYGNNFPIFAKSQQSEQFTLEGMETPVFIGTTIEGWRSPAGVQKHPTGRRLGTPGHYLNWSFGYSTPGTTSEWVDALFKSSEKRGMMIQITNYLKKEARKRNK